MKSSITARQQWEQQADNKTVSFKAHSSRFKIVPRDINIEE